MIVASSSMDLRAADLRSASSSLGVPAMCDVFATGLFAFGT